MKRQGFTSGFAFANLQTRSNKHNSKKKRKGILPTWGGDLLVKWVTADVNMLMSDSNVGPL
jgi:hypothetical protein